jgi:hypothetical protein
MQGLFKLSARVYYLLQYRKNKQHIKLSRKAFRADNPRLQAWNTQIIKRTAFYLQRNYDLRQ